MNQDNFNVWNIDVKIYHMCFFNIHTTVQNLNIFNTSGNVYTPLYYNNNSIKIIPSPILTYY